MFTGRRPGQSMPQSEVKGLGTDWAILNGDHWAVVNWAVNPQHWWPSQNGCFVGNDPPAGHSFVTDYNFWFIWTNRKNHHLLPRWCDIQPHRDIINGWIELGFNLQCNYLSMHMHLLVNCPFFPCFFPTLWLQRFVPRIKLGVNLDFINTYYNYLLTFFLL